MKLWDLMESPVASVRDLRRRTTILAFIHVVLTASSVALLLVLALRLKLLVTLSQRSNVETLLILFFAAFVTVLLITTGRSTLGAITLFGLRGLPADRRQRWIQAHHVEPRREERTLAATLAGWSAACVVRAVGVSMAPPGQGFCPQRRSHRGGSYR